MLNNNQNNFSKSELEKYTAMSNKAHEINEAIENADEKLIKDIVDKKIMLSQSNIEILNNANQNEDKNIDIKSYINETLTSKMIMINKKINISAIIENYLKYNWKFINSDDWLFYIFNISNTLYEIKSNDFYIFTSSTFWINRTETIFKYVISNIEVVANNIWEFMKVRRFSYYDKLNNICYISMHNNTFIEVKVNEINIRNNGYNWIFFINKREYTPWMFHEDTLNSKDYINVLISSLSLSWEYWQEFKEDVYILLKNWIISLFIPEFLTSRPILLFMWQMWSWKSFFLKVVIQLLLWEGNGLTVFPNNYSSMEAFVVNNYFCFLDNVDWTLSSKFIDLIASVTTWGWFKSRELYTNYWEIKKKVNCFIWITSQDPKFLRPDIVDRSIPIYMKRLDSFTHEDVWIKVYMENRNLILSSLVYDIQNTLRNISENKTYWSEIRLADFANLLYNSRLNWYKDEDIHQLISRLSLSQQRLTRSNDIFWDLLLHILENWKDFLVHWKYYKSDELHSIFVKYAKKHSWILHYDFKWKVWMARVLTNNSREYNIISWIIIKTKIVWANNKLYSLSITDE